MRMPWKIEERDGKYCVIKESDGSTEKCHATREEATAHMRALYANEPPETRAELSAASVNDLPDSAFAYIEPGGTKDAQGKTVPRSKRHFPIHDAAHVRNALARAPQSPFGDKAMPKIKAAARKFGVSMAETRGDNGPIELRNATVGDVNFPKRLIEIVAVPYDEDAVVEYRGLMWLESFERGAFDGIETAPREIRANREHNMADIVGKAIQWFPSRVEGLVGMVKIAKTPRGEETLALADEDMLSASAGFAAKPSWQHLDKVNMRRRIKRAFLDHIAFVGAPAYAGAGVLSVRHQGQQDGQEGPSTPLLDEVVAWMEARRAQA